MLNYVAMQVVTFCIVYWENPAGSNSVGIINAPTRAGWLPQLFGLDYGWNLAIVLLLTVLMFIYMKRTKHGYEIAVVGESENTARYAGINVGKVIVRTVGKRFFPHNFYKYSRRPWFYCDYRSMACEV